MTTNPTRMCEILVGLPAVNILEVEEIEGGEVRVTVESRVTEVPCPACGSATRVKERPIVELVDLPCCGRAVRLLWRKHRLACPVSTCTANSWTVEDSRIAPPRGCMTTRAGRWATLQVGKYGRSVNEVARDIGCDWHTVNDAVVAYGAILVDHPDRIGTVTALGLDETLFVREGERHRQVWSTSIVDVAAAQLLDVIKGRDARTVVRWVQERPEQWQHAVAVGTLDLSSSYRAVFDKALPHTTLVADPFHVVKVANSQLDRCRRRVQNATLGHRGRKDDPLYRCRKLLLKAEEKLDEKGKERRTGLLRAGDPKGEVARAWEAKEAVRDIYKVPPALAVQWVTQLATDLQDEVEPDEVRSLGRTLVRWCEQIANWHLTQLSNGPTEAMNNLIKRVKRVAFGFRRFSHFRIRVLLYCGKPDWSLLATATPR